MNWGWNLSEVSRLRILIGVIALICVIAWNV